MTRHDPRTSVHHMLDHAQEAVKMVQGRRRADLDSDRLLNLALVRLMEVIGEAATRVPEDFRQRYPEVPWHDITVNVDRLWTIIEQDLPPLIEQLGAIVQEEI